MGGILVGFTMFDCRKIKRNAQKWSTPNAMENEFGDLREVHAPGYQMVAALTIGPQ